LIRQATIQNIIETARVEEVIGDFVTLKKRGANYLGLCPFHNEKTPSFSVSPSKGIYKCFGCGKAGNVVNFIMEHEHYSYPEALKYLARRYGIEVEEEELTPEMKQEQDEHESMFVVNSFIANHFQENLFSTGEGQSIGLTYLKERDFRESTIKNFQLGYAIDSWEAYSKYAVENGYKQEILVKTGLSIEKDNRLIDRFKGRIIFPIHNLTGKVIGFGGRILSSEKSTAKYINSPESDIYNKSRVLYGIYFARNEIVKQNNCLLVEGYTDVISLFQAGIENVVSSSGTSLTVDQIKLIKRFTPNITILYDGDPAGIKASFRGIDLILEQGLNVKIVLFPEGEDPDSFVRSHRTSEVIDFIKKKAVDFIKFKTGLLLDETVGDPAGRATLIKEIVNTIAYIPDGISRSVYIKECSIVMDIPEQTLMNELNKSLRKKYSKQLSPDFDELPARDEKSIQPIKIEIDPLEIKDLENEIMRFILNYGNQTIVAGNPETGQDEKWKIIDYIIADFNNDQIEFENPVYNAMISEYKKASEEGQQLETSYFINHQDPKIVTTVVELIADKEQLSENWKKNKIYVKKAEDNLENYLVSLILPLKSKLIGKELRKIVNKLKFTTDEAEWFILQQQYFELKKIANLIDNKLNRVINH
jgi:DNA primase